MRRCLVTLTCLIAVNLMTGCEAQKEQIEVPLDKAHKAAQISDKRNAEMNKQAQAMTDEAQDELDKEDKE